MSMDSPIEETTSFSATKKSSLFSSPLHLPAIWTRTNANAEGPTPTIKETALRKPTIRFPCEGLKVSALANFVAVCGGEKKIKYLTTQQIVEKCILPVTAANKSSYCELIKARDPSVVCHATAYISHSWGANFMDTYRAIRYHFRNSPDATLWIDIFCLDQRIFYPKRIRKGKCAAFGDAADLLSTSVGAGASEQASFFSPFRMTFGHNTGDHSRGAESPGASSTGGVSVMSTNSAANHEYDGMEPTAAVGAQNAKVSTTYQWNGLHTGMAGDWCADILKHGIDQIGHVVLIVNPNPNPEPKSGDQGDMGKAGSGKGVVEGGVAATATAAATEAEAAGAGVEQYDQPAENALLWDKSRYVNPKHALNRLWCLYEVYCTTVDRSHTPVVAAVARAHSPAAAEALASGEGVGVNANFSPRVASRGNENSQVVASAAAGAGPKRGGGGSGGTKKACTFDIAMHYSILSDGQHGSSANVKNKRNPFTIDLQVTCRDFEHLMKWVCAVKLESCAASDVADAERLLHIINVDVGATIFIDTVRNVLSSWIVKSMNENSHEIGNLDARNATATYTNTLLNTSTNKSRLYIQRCLCNLFHVKGDTFRAEGSLIELSEQQKGKLGAQHPDYLDSLQYLAEFYLDLSRHADAEPILIECLERRKGVLGPEHPDTIHTLDLLANLYDVLGNYHLAEPLFEECFDLRRKTLGPLHISSLKSMYSVSCMMFNQAEYELAEALMRECLDLRRTALGATHLDTVASLQKLAVLYEIQKDYPAAELLYHEYLHASMAVYGNDHVNTINALYLLGVNYKNQFKYSLAEQVLRITIDKYRATLSADHDCTLRAIYDLAALYEDVAQYENSLTVRTQYFDLCKARFGEEVSHKSHHKTPAAAKVNKANQNHNILPIAEDEKVQNLAQKGCAKTHQCMYDLAGLHVKMGKCSRALPLLMRCLELRLQQIGASHVDTLATQNQLAYVHINSGNYDAAEALLVQSIEEGSRMNAAMQADANNDGSGNKKKQAQQNAAPNISLSHNSHIGGDPEHHHVRFSAEAVLGEADYYDTPYLAISNGEPHHSQSNDYIQSNSHEGSNRSLLSNNEEVLREEVEMRLPAVVDAMNNLGLMYTEQGKLTEAEALFMNAWESYRRIYQDETHPDVLTAVHNLAGLYVKQEKFEMAEYLFADCLKKRTSVLGARHPATLHTLCNLAAVYTHLGKYEIAEHMIEECQAECTSLLGADHPTSLRNINNLAANCEAQGNLRRAEVLYKQCLVKRRLSLGATHPETLSSNNNLAALYVTQLQQFKEAERMLKDCLKARQTILGLRHPDTMGTINNLATLYVRLSKEDLAHDVYIDCTEECIDQLGRTHPVTAKALANLQHLVVMLNKDNIINTSVMPSKGTNSEQFLHEEELDRDYERQYGQDGYGISNLQHGKLTIQTSPSPKKKGGKKHRTHHDIADATKTNRYF